MASGRCRAAISLISPDGRNEILVQTVPVPDAEEQLGFAIRRDGRAWMHGSFGLELQGMGDVFRQAGVQSDSRRTVDDTYLQPGHKRNPVRDHFHESILDLEGNGPLTHLRLELRAYDDGVAFRYVLPRQNGIEDIAITDERSQWNVVGDPKTWPLYLDHFQTSHEDDYESASWSRLRTETLMGLPLLLEFAEAAVAVTEAGLSNYAGLYLTARRGEGALRLVSTLSPLRRGGLVKVRGQLPLATPWRVFLMGDRAGDLIESSLVLNLNAPSAIGDASWLRFGKTTWNWWNGYYQQPVDFKTGANFATLKHYIDFCAENGIAFHAIDCADANTSWYVQDSPGFAPGPGADIVTPRPELEFARALQYAQSRGVGIRLWVHSELLAPRLEEAFARYQEWGVEGLMVDFLDRNDQEMVQWSERVLQVAARHHLRIQFHGVWPPSGRRRTYPNLVNHEAVLNLEYLKWSDRCDPEHNLITPYTRMLAGPMDYHLGGFQAVPRERFEFRNIQPRVLGTRCHHLAMYVVYENPVPMVADGPSAYVGQPGFDFLRQVPTVWDETRFLAGEVGDFIAVARRRGEDWYVGAMTDWTPRRLEVSLDFLKDRSYRAAIWADDPMEKDPNRLLRKTRLVTALDQFIVDMARGGGQVMHLTPASVP